MRLALQLDLRSAPRSALSLPRPEPRQPGRPRPASPDVARTAPAGRLTIGLVSGVLGILGVLGLAGCASPVPANADKATQGERVVGAATAPLADLNVLRTKIPEALQAARQHPYALPADASCASLGAEIAQLDEALGPDLDAPHNPDNPSLIERGGESLGNAAIDTLKGTTEAIVPLRSWVRKLTGAERHSKDVAAAIHAGAVRRGFLKGVRNARGCA